jgi:hypothetical protein
MENELLFQEQVSRLGLHHFLILYWAALSEAKGVRYNITNAFDDMKFQKLTRTKQTAVANIEALALLGFVDLKDESNRKNIYITKFGAEALQVLGENKRFKTKKSLFLEVTK